MKLKIVLPLIITLLFGATLIVNTRVQASVDTLTIAYIGGSRADSDDQQAYQAAVLAAEELNNSGDIEDPDGTNYQFEVNFYPADNLNDVLDAFDEALDDNVVAVLGLNNAAYRQEVLDFYGTSPVPILYSGADEEDETNLFPMFVSTDVQVESIADYLVNIRYFQRIATVTINTDSAEAGLEKFLDAVDDTDLIALSIVHDVEDDNVSGDASAINDANADALFLWTLDSQAADLLTELNSIGWHGTVVYMALDQNFVENAGADVTIGVIGPAQWSPYSYESTSKSFVIDYQARWGTQTSSTAATCYDAVSMLAIAVQLSGAGDIADGLEVVNYDGVSGYYDDAQAQTLRLVSVADDGRLLETARYNSQVCVTCADIWYPDVADSGSSTGIYNIALITSLDDTGQHMQQAAQLAINEVNAAGGVIGADDVRYNLRLHLYEASNTAEVNVAMTEIMTDDIQIILGPDLNAQVISNSTTVASTELPLLTSATGLQNALSGVGDYIFQLRPDDQTLASSAVDYVVNQLGLDSIASVVVRTEYGLDSANAISQSAAENGAILRLSLDHAIDEDFFGDMMVQIIDSGVDAVFAWTIPSAAEALLEELDVAGWDGVFVYGYLTSSNIEMLDTTTNVQVIAPVNWWNVADDWTSFNFVETYSQRFGEMPIAQSAAYYDAIHLIAHGLQESGADPASMEIWLAEQNGFIGVQGVYDTASYGTGELTQDTIIVGISDDGVQELYRNLDTTTAGTISSSTVSTTSSSCPITAAYNVNLRSQANEDATILEVIPYQSVISAATRIDDNWYRVAYDGTVGYVQTAYLTFNNCSSTAATSTVSDTSSQSCAVSLIDWSDGSFKGVTDVSPCPGEIQMCRNPYASFTGAPYALGGSTFIEYACATSGGRGGGGGFPPRP